MDTQNMTDEQCLVNGIVLCGHESKLNTVRAEQIFEYLNELYTMKSKYDVDCKEMIRNISFWFKHPKKMQGIQDAGDYFSHQYDLFYHSVGLWITLTSQGVTGVIYLNPQKDHFYEKYCFMAAPDKNGLVIPPIPRDTSRRKPCRYGIEFPSKHNKSGGDTKMPIRQREIIVERINIYGIRFYRSRLSTAEIQAILVLLQRDEDIGRIDVAINEATYRYPAFYQVTYWLAKPDRIRDDCLELWIGKFACAVPEDFALVVKDASGLHDIYHSVPQRHGGKFVKCDWPR